MKVTFYKNRWVSFCLSLLLLAVCFFLFKKKDRSIGFDYEFFFFTITCFFLCVLIYSFLLFLFSLRDKKYSSNYYSSKYIHSLAVKEVLKTKKISFSKCLKKDLEDLEQRRYIIKKDDKYAVTTILKNYGVFDSHLRIITDFLQNKDKAFSEFLVPEFRKCYLKFLQSDMIQAGLLERQGIFFDALSYVLFLFFLLLLSFFSFHGFLFAEISSHFGQLFCFFAIACIFQFICFHFLLCSPYRVTAFGKNYEKERSS